MISGWRSQDVNTDSTNKTEQNRNNTKTTKTYPEQQQNSNGFLDQKAVSGTSLHTQVSLIMEALLFYQPFQNCPKLSFLSFFF